jgi:hypothetical protein
MPTSVRETGSTPALRKIKSGIKLAKEKNFKRKE